MVSGRSTTELPQAVSSVSIDELYAIAFAATIDPNLAVAAVHEGIAMAGADTGRVDRIAAVLTAALSRAPREQPVPASVLEPVLTSNDASATDDLVAVAIALSVVLPAWDRAVLELSIRHDLDGRDLAEILDRVPGTVGLDVHAARDQIERLVGSGVLAHVMRRECPELDAVLAGLPTEPTASDLADHVSAHLETCAACSDRRRGLAPMVNLLTTVDVPPPPATLRGPMAATPPRRRMPFDLHALTPRRVLLTGVAALVVGVVIGTVIGVTTRSTNNERTALPTHARLLASTETVDFGAITNTQSVTVRNNDTRGPVTFSIHADVPWLAVSPSAGAVPPGSSAPITITLDRATAPEGANHGEVRVVTDAGDTVIAATAVVERAPVIGTLNVTPNELAAANCSAANQANLMVRVVEESGLQNAQIHVRVGSQTKDQSTPMQDDKGVERATLGPFPPGPVTYWVTATDVRNNTATSPQQTLTVNGC